MLFLDGGMKILEGPTVVLCINGDDMVLDVEENSMTFPTYGWDLKSGLRTGISIAYSRLFPWVESGGTVSHSLPQSVTKTHCCLCGSTANAPAIVP
jgi:hypothetical protein